MRFGRKLALGLTIIAGTAWFYFNGMNNPVIKHKEPVVHNIAYNADDIWYERMQDLENLALTTRVDTLTDKHINDLILIGATDKHPINQELANDMVNSYKKHGDFSETEPVRQKEQENARKEILLYSADMNYNANDKWYVRIDSLKQLTHRDITVDQLFMDDLLTIQHDDDDWRIRKLAHDMRESVIEKGDFSNTEPYRAHQAELHR